MDNNKYTNVVTLIADPNHILLNENEINSVVDMLQANGAIVEDVEWLAEERACDIFFAVLSIEDACELLTHLLANVPFDFVVQSAHGRKKKLLITDMDSTIIEQECIDELADFVGLKDKISQITERAMNGELEFEDALKERVLMLKGLSEDTLDKAFSEKITFTPGAKELVATMANNGARTVLVSGGFTFFTNKVKESLGFDEEEANILVIENGELTGEVQEPIVGSHHKAESLKLHANDLCIGTTSVVAVGDGANDIPMLKLAGLGIAFHAKDKVKEQVRAKIDTCDLTALLYAQGYKSNEIIE